MEERINHAAREHEVKVTDWRFGRVSRVLFEFFDLINDRFFGTKVPTPVVSFKRTRRHLGHYIVGRNEIGVLKNININITHLLDPLQEVLATLCHETGHSWQRNFGKLGAGNYHNREFRRKMAVIGIPCSRWGVATGMTEPFVSFLRSNGVEADAHLTLPFEETECVRSGSRLAKWNCDCGEI